jgi:multidrug efflux pump subunit AcrA (membrane-fusion protein)
VEEGATVREDQVLLQIPDLRQMQVKVGVHEAYVDRLKPGMRARVTLLADTIDAEVSTIASIARRSGWWTGNMVKYDTVIKIDTGEDSTYRPGMSASVDIILAEHVDVLTIPVAAVVETNRVYHCWVKEGNQTKKRVLDVGDSDDEFMVVKTGVKAGDKVVLNPRAYIEEAQREGLEPTASGEEKPKADEPKPKKPKADKPKPKKPSKP